MILGLGHGLGFRGRVPVGQIFAANRAELPFNTFAVSGVYAVTWIAFWTGDEAVTNPVLYFPNYYLPTSGGSAGAEVAIASQIKVKAKIKVGSTTTDAAFSGAAEVTIASGEDAYSDPVPITIPANTQYWVATRCEFASGGARPGSYTSDATRSEYAFFSSSAATIDTAFNGTYTPNSAVTGYGPGAVLGTPVSGRRKSIAIIGDSLSMGANENRQNGDARGNRGYLGRGLDSVGAAFGKLGMNGATIANLRDAAFTKRMILLRRAATAILYEAAENDLGSGYSTVTTALGSAWDYFTAQTGLPIIYSKTGPKTASTDSWATTANQTPAASDLYTATINTARPRFSVRLWADTQVGTRLRATIDPISYWQDGTDLDKWKVNGAANYPTSDGLHPSAELHDAAKTCVVNAFNAGLFD